MLLMDTKKWPAPVFTVKKKILAVVVEIVDLALEIYIINYLIKKWNFETNFIMSKERRKIGVGCFFVAVHSILE